MTHKIVVAIRLLSLAMAFNVTTVAVAQSPRRFTPVGVLVGLHQPGGTEDLSPNTDSEPPSSGQLRTLWIHQLDPGKAFEPLVLPNLLVPRRSGFWQMGLHGQCLEGEEKAANDTVLGTETTVADHLWAARVGGQPKVRLNDPDPQFRDGPCVARNIYCVNDWTTGIYWVWPEFASLDLGERSECGAHPNWDPGYTVRGLDDLGKPLRVGEVLGQSAEDAFQRSFERRAKEEDHCGEKFEADSWYINRENGEWKASGWSTTHRLCGYGFDYTVNVDLSAITGRRDDRSRWQRLKADLPQAVDAHFSPDGQWMLVTTETELLIFQGTSSGQPVLKWSKSRQENLVMVEWVTGRNVARWNDEVVHVGQMKQQAPLIIRK